MSREIKFRAYDKFNGLYYHSDQKSTLADFFELCQACIDGGNEIIYQQFTGLKDKKGKEIYEDDILKLQYPVNYGFGGIHSKEIIVTISFEGAAFWFTGGGFTDCNWHFYNAEDREVIGNIYQHPELLKQPLTA